MRRLAIAVLALAALAVVPATASAAPTIDGIFPTGATPLSSKPGYLTLGPDGNIWVVLDSTDKVAKVTPQGAVTEYQFNVPTHILTNIVGIAAGPDGKLWVTENNKVASFTTADPVNTATEFGIPSDNRGITKGPDNNMWAVTATGVTRFSTNNPMANNTPFPGVTGGRGISPGPNNTILVADFGGARIVSFTTAGVATNLPTGGGPQEVVAGPNGQIGYTNPGATPETVGRITPPGAAQETITPGGGDPFGITLANDGAYWIARFATNDIMRFTPDGQSSFISAGLPTNAGPRFITRGQGDTLWASLQDSSGVPANFRIARISGVSAPTNNGGGGGGADTTAPKLSSVSLSATTFRLGSLLPRLTRTTPTGTTIRFRVDEQSKTSLAFKRFTSGRRVGRRCLAATRARRHLRRCTRLVAAGRKLTYTTSPGLHRIRFQGRFSRTSRLAPGRYQLEIVSVDAAGNRSVAVRKVFTLKPALVVRRHH